MNMMSKIYASTAMSPVELGDQNATALAITLPLVTPDVSPALAALIEAYADAVNSHSAKEDDQDFDDGGLMEQIIAWPARSYADLAAKTALSMYELRGRARLTAGSVYLPVEFEAAVHAEDLMIAASHDARRLASCTALPSSSTEWDKALAAYRAARASSEAMPLGAAGEDEAVDTYCDLMDHLIENVPAPDGDALATKLMLAFDRCEDFTFLDCYKEPIIADARRLDVGARRAVRGQTISSKPPHGRWDATLTAYMAAKAKYDASPKPREDDDPDMLAMMAAEDELIRTPAPDLMALRTKMHLEYFRGCMPGDSEWKAIRSDVERLATEGEGLSPAMAEVLSKWEIVAWYFDSFEGAGDEPGNTLCRQYADAGIAVARIPALTAEDVHVKTYLLAIEATDVTAPGSLSIEIDQTTESHLWNAVIGDLSAKSLAIRGMVERGERANDWINRWETSGGSFHLDPDTKTPVMGQPIKDGQDWLQLAELMREFEASTDLKPIIRAIIAGRLGGSI